MQNENGLSDRLGGCFDLAHFRPSRFIPRIDKKRDQAGLREEVAQHFQALGSQLGRKGAYPGRVAGWPAQARDKAELHWVATNAEHDRNGPGRLLCRNCRACASRDQYRRPKPNQLGGECRQAIGLPFAEAILDRDILADDEARLF
jgi:hypothetical protein